MLYGAVRAVALASPRRSGRPVSTSVVGRHCESGDVLADDVLLPEDLAVGDVLAMAATGAYTYPLASAYNRFGRPAVVAVANGRAHRWVRREDAADMDRLEVAGPVSPSEPQALPDGIEIRPARPGDAASFLEFWRAIVAEGRFVRTDRVHARAGEYRRRFRRSWTDDDAEIMALEGRRVVGHVAVTRERHPVTSHVVSLGIAVAAGMRGHGIGTALMHEAFRWARGAGVQKIVLSVYPHNTPAIALYRRFGFVEEGRLSRRSRKSYGYEDEILMAAWIGPDEMEVEG
jgi:RimJ/RimL family protein N-acetyltransferase